MSRIMIGCPVRNRAWILPFYLQYLTALNYPQEQIEYCFVINDSTDDTETILLEFARRFPTRLLYDNSSRPGGWKRGFYQFSRLADLRNRLLEEFLQSHCDYLFSVDSDILVPANCLQLLLQAEGDVVSALVCNGEEIGDDRFYNVFTLIENHLQPIRDFPRDRLFPVDCTGAAYLIKRRVISAGVRYNSRWGPEDVGFCREAKEHGFTIFCHGGVECCHIMQNSQKYGLERPFSSG
jgi:GT2 family glycosyltransferase